MYNDAMLQPLAVWANSRSAGRLVLAMTAASFALRVWIANLFLRTPYHEFTLHISGPDQNRFLLWAEGIRAGTWSAPGADPASVFQYSPVYPWLLSVSIGWAKEPFLAILTFQAFLSAWTGWAIWDCGRRLGTGAAGLIGAALWLFYGPSVFFDGCLIRESLLASTGFLSFWLALSAWDRGSAARSVAAGAALGLGAAIRPHIWGPALLLGFVLAALKRREPKRLLCAFLLALTACAWNAPVAVRNHLVSGGFTPAATQGADAFILGNDPEGPGVSHVPTENSARMLRESGGGILGAVPVIVREFTAKPEAALELYRRKLRMLFNDHEVGANYSFYVWKFLIPPARGFFLTWGWIFPPAVIGAWFAWRRRGGWRWVLAGAGILLAGAAVVHIQARYRFAAVPFIALLAGYGLAGTARTVLRKKWLSAALCGSVLWTAAVLVRPDPSYGYHRVTGLDGVTRPASDPIKEPDYLTLLVSWSLSGAEAHRDVIRVVSRRAALIYGPSVALHLDRSVRELTGERSPLSRAYRRKYGLI